MMLFKIFRYKGLLPVISAILLCLTLPPIDAGFLVWFALVPLLIYIAVTENTKKIFWAGTTTGTLYGIKVLYPLSTLNAWWWTNPSGILWEMRTEILTIFLCIVAFYSGGLFIGLFSVLFKKFRRNPIANILLFPGVWIVSEFLREPLVLSFTWGHLGYALHDNPSIAQLATLGLVYALSFIIVAINIGIFEIFVSTYSYIQGLGTSNLHFKNILRHLMHIPALHSLIALIVLVSLFGHYSITKDRQNRGTLRIAAIHMDIKTEDSAGVEAFNAYLALLDEALGDDPDIIVFPENAFPFFVIDQETMLPLKYENGASNIRKLFDTLRGRSTSSPETAFVIGTHSIADTKIHNSIIVLENGLITSVYNKRRLMPFAEDDSKIFNKETTESFAKGRQQQTITARGLHGTPLICSEIIFPRLSRNTSSNFIINVSNDSVFGSRLVGLQNHAIAKIRAIENKKFLIRSVKGGISSIIDPFGHTVAQKTGKRGVIFADIVY